MDERTRENPPEQPHPELRWLPSASAEEREAGLRDARRQRRLLAIGLMCGAVAMFTALDTTAKFLGGHMNIVQLVWGRYASAFLLALLFVNPWTAPGLTRSKRPVLQIVRSALLLASTLLNFVALRYLQLDQTTSILFATPFVVAVLSGPLLGEWIGWRRWIAIIVGFLGVLVVTRPGAGGIHPAALFTCGGVVCYALYNISTRVLSKSDTNETTLFYSNLIGFAAMSAVVPFFWDGFEDWSIVALLTLCGAFGSVGHYLLIIAHRHAPAGVLAPYIYTQIVWMILAGFLVFGDLPNGWTLTGAAIVIASGCYLFYRERMVKGEG